MGAGDKGVEAVGEGLLERGATIDRFVVLGLVGRGGMGEVYAAYDPELDRKVAIKLLRARGDSEEGRARLLREAQATAKLQHPNVVVVYDVGTFGQSVFIAMEFIEGRTANGWLHAATRSRREILDVYLAAGRGLAAAHAAGLVHRDFKPDNVMVTNDGQVRVMDFGLARQLDEPDGPSRASALPAQAAATSAERAAVSEALSESYDPESTRDLRKGAAPDVTSSSGKYLSLKLTQTGAMLGTPAYMAPEQFAVKATDARTDQFSFCVALYEALYGKRPFDGETFLALMTSVTTGSVSPPPGKTKVPGWLRKVLLRGLQTDPDRRLSSMSALLTALQSDPTVRARRVAGVAIALAALAATVVGVRRFGGAREAMCRGGGERLAGIWEPAGAASPRKEAVHRAFLATGKTFAERAFTGASRYLDEYVGAWLGMYSDACEATQVRGEQSAEVLDLRMGCLQERLVDLRALTDQLAAANDKIVENAVSATSTLPSVGRCADISLLRAVVKPPVDEAARRRVELLREQKARLLAFRFTSKCDEGRRLEDELLRGARAAGYLPLLAETLEASAFLEDECGGSAEAQVALYREAFTTAIASRHDRVAAETALFVTGQIADRTRDLAAASQWLAIGRGMVTRIGGGDAEIRAALAQAEGTIAQYAGKYDEAISHFEQCRIENEKAHGPDHPYIATALTGTALTYQLAGNPEAALAAMRRVVDTVMKATSPDHPLVAQGRSNMGETLNALRRFPEARAQFERAIEIWNAQHADPTILAYARTGLGLALLGEGRPRDALAPLEDALAARTEAHAPVELVAETSFALARALWSKPSSRAHALALAGTARSELAAQTSPAAQEAVKPIAAWLRAPTSAL